MNLYAKLFGLNLMKPLDGDGGDLGGAADRGDNFTPADSQTGKPESSDPDDADDLDVALGKDKEAQKDGEDDGQPRDATGKFAKKERENDTAIPKSRFDEAVRKERERAEAAERALDEIRRAQQQVARGADIDKLESQVKDLRAQERKALIAGDDEKAAELSDQADRLNRQIAIEQARDMSVQAKEQAREEIRWDMTIERIEEKYPQLNEASEEFDQELTDEVVDIMNGIARRERLPRSQALLKAVEKVMTRVAAPAKTETEEPKGLDRGAEKGRKEAAVAKNLDAAKRQPASTKQVGADSDKFGQSKEVPDAADMTYEEFNALPETTRAKMRGDFV